MIEIISDLELKSQLKNVVKNCIDIESQKYGDFSNEFIEKSGFDFCPIETEFFDPSDSTCYGNNLTKFCMENEFNELYAINPEYIDDEYLLDDFFQGYPGSITYRIFVEDNSILNIANSFNYSPIALIFPPNLSFFVLMTDSYDILAGSKNFIEFILGEDILKKMDRFQNEIEMGKSMIGHSSFKYLHNKYRSFLHHKYDNKK